MPRATAPSGWRAKFLRELSRTGCVSYAARLAKKHRGHVARVRAQDAAFDLACIEAIDFAADRLEREAWRRGVRGYNEPVYHGGVQVGRVRRYSDSLLMMLLRGARPGKYLQRMDVTSAGGCVGTKIIIVPPEPPEQLAANSEPARMKGETTDQNGGADDSAATQE